MRHVAALHPALVPHEGIAVYCDGSGTCEASSPACVGVVAYLGRRPVVEASARVSLGTNNVAELEALGLAAEVALALHRQCGAPMVAYSDSTYAIGVLSTDAWQVRSNRDLVHRLRPVVQGAVAAGLLVEHVHGHDGTWGNHVADWLAGRARAEHLRRTFRQRPQYLAEAGRIRDGKRNPSVPIKFGGG